MVTHTVENVVDGEGEGGIRLKLSFLDKRKKRAAKWTHTNAVNPLNQDEESGNPSFAWTSRAWASLWEVYSKQTRPYTMEPPKSKGGRPPPDGVYVVEKVLAFKPEDATFKVKWLGYKSPTFEPSSSFVTGVDTYCWDSKGAWEHFCQVGPQAFKPLFEEIAPAADSKKGGASKTPRTAPQPRSGRANGTGALPGSAPLPTSHPDTTTPMPFGNLATDLHGAATGEEEPGDEFEATATAAAAAAAAALMAGGSEGWDAMLQETYAPYNGAGAQHMPDDQQQAQAEIPFEPQQFQQLLDHWQPAPHQLPPQMSLQQLLQEGLAGAQAKPSPTQPLLPPSQKEQQEQQAEKQRLQEEKKREQNRRKREQAQRKRLEKRLKQQAKAAGKKRATPPQPQTAATHLSPNSHGNNQKGGAVGPTSGTADTLAAIRARKADEEQQQEQQQQELQQGGAVDHPMPARVQQLRGVADEFALASSGMDDDDVPELPATQEQWEREILAATQLLSQPGEQQQQGPIGHPHDEQHQHQHHYQQHQHQRGPQYQRPHSRRGSLSRVDELADIPGTQVVGDGPPFGPEDTSMMQQEQQQGELGSGLPQQQAHHQPPPLADHMRAVHKQLQRRQLLQSGALRMSPTQPLVVAGWTRAAALAAAKAAAAAVVGEHAGDGGGGVFSAEEAAEGAGEGDGPQEGSGRALEEGEGEGEGEGLAAGEEGGSGAAHGAQLLQGRGGTAKGGGGSGSVQFMVSAPAMELCADVMATQGGRVRANARYDSSAAHAAEMAAMEEEGLVMLGSGEELIIPPEIYVLAFAVSIYLMCTMLQAMIEAVHGPTPATKAAAAAAAAEAAAEAAAQAEAEAAKGARDGQASTSGRQQQQQQQQQQHEQENVHNQEQNELEGGAGSNGSMLGKRKLASHGLAGADQDACHHLLLLAGAKRTRHSTFQSWPGTQPPHTQPNSKASKQAPQPTSRLASVSAPAATTAAAAAVGAPASPASPAKTGASKQAPQAVKKVPPAVLPQGGANNNKKRKVPEAAVSNFEPHPPGAQKHQTAGNRPQHHHQQQGQQHTQPGLLDGEDMPGVEFGPGAEPVPVQQTRVYEKGGVLEEAPPEDEEMEEGVEEDACQHLLLLAGSQGSLQQHNQRSHNHHEVSGSHNQHQQNSQQNNQNNQESLYKGPSQRIRARLARQAQVEQELHAPEQHTGPKRKEYSINAGAHVPSSADPVGTAAQQRGGHLPVVAYPLPPLPKRPTIRMLLERIELMDAIIADKVAIEVATHLPSPPEPSPAYPPAAHQRLQQQQHLNSGGPLAAGQGVRAELAHPRMAIGAPVGMVPRLEGPPPGELGPCLSASLGPGSAYTQTPKVYVTTPGGASFLMPALGFNRGAVAAAVYAKLFGDRHGLGQAAAGHPDLSFHNSHPPHQHQQQHHHHQHHPAAAAALGGFAGHGEDPFLSGPSGVMGNGGVGPGTELGMGFARSRSGDDAYVGPGVPAVMFGHQAPGSGSQGGVGGFSAAHHVHLGDLPQAGSRMPEPPREWMGGGPQSSMPMRCAAHSEQFEMAMRALHSWQRSSNGAPKQPPAVMPHNHPVPRQGPLSQQNQQQQQQAQEQRDEGQGTYPPHSFPQRQPQLEGQQQQQQQQPPQGQKQQRKQSAESDGSDTQVQGASAATPTLTTASANTNAPERAGGSGRDDGSSQRRQHHAHTQGVTRNDGSPIKQQQQQQRRQSLPSASAAGPQECPAALPPTEPSLRPPLTHGTQGDVSGADGTPEVHMDGNPSGNPAAHTDGNPSGNQAPVQGLSRGFLPARRPGPPRPSQVSQPAVNGATVAETNDAGPV